MGLPSNLVRTVGPATKIAALAFNGTSGPTFLEFVKAQARLPSLLEDDEPPEGAFVEDDALLTVFTNSAYDKLEELTALVLLNSSFSLYVPRNGCIEFPVLPVTGITSFSYFDTSEVNQVWASSNYQLEPATVDWQVEHQELTLLNCLPCVSYKAAYPIVVAFTAGCGTTIPSIPDAAQLAIAQLVAFWYKNREALSILPPETDPWWGIVDLLQKTERYG